MNSFWKMVKAEEEFFDEQDKIMRNNFKFCSNNLFILGDLKDISKVSNYANIKN